MLQFFLDISPLLLCRSDNIIIESLTDSSALTTQLPAAPLCINPKDLQVYKGKNLQFIIKSAQYYL